jgi:hypothetical protein
MRTKTLLLTAALTAAGVATSMAQAVYSVNAVGYVNISVNQRPASSSTLLMFANPLNTGGNTVSEVFPSLPDGTLLFTFNNGTGQFDSAVTFAFGAWDVPTHPVPPGGGGFLQFDNSFAPNPIAFTYVGEVPEGAPLSTAVPGAGRLSLLASKAPISGQLDTDLGFPAADGDLVFRWDKANYRYTDASTFAFGSWDIPPVLGVGDGFVLVPDPSTPARTWTKNFDVTP